MNDNLLPLSAFDVARLSTLLERTLRGGAPPAHLLPLLNRVLNAEESDPAQVPEDVVTMNSRVRLHDRQSGEDLVCTLVFPHEADATAGRISVLAPLGAALLGARVGALVEAALPHGARHFTVEELLFQPEAAGRFDL